MDLTILITSGSFIVLGFLVKYFPNLIAGYNTMSPEKKKNVDVKGLATFMRNGMIVMGISILAGYYLFLWLGMENIADVIILLVTVPGVIIMLFRAQKFDHNND